MKYKNISTEGSYATTEGGKRVIKPGCVKQFKLNRIFVAVFPGEMINCPVELNDPEMELIPEKKAKEVPKKEVKKAAEKGTKPEEKKLLSKEELKKFTKDGLNDYAARLDFDKIDPAKMKHSEMLEEILKFQNEIK